MSKEKRNKSGKIIGLAAVTSALAGAAAALLLAPKTGKETRDTLKNSVTKGKSSLTDATSDFRSNASDAKKKIAEYLDEKKRKKAIVTEVYLQAFDTEEDEVVATSEEVDN